MKNNCNYENKEMDRDETQCSIKAVEVFKSYEKNEYVLNGLSIEIKSGTIYGLLGASGCGKSTLLQCILGEIALDSGSVYLKTNNIKNIGYMPQELGLDTTLTLKETFEYYGLLYSMSKNDIKKRVAELNTFLQLPDLNSYIQDISGGQCRRVSLGVTLLHDPEIIILDEPTVGIDPVTRFEIWAEFTNMAINQNKTIVITTHYIDEACQANCVGLMRNGVLVEEGNPQDLLTKHNTDSLESAFLSLCYDQDSNKIVQNDDQAPKNSSQSNKLLKFEKKISPNRIKALIKKNARVGTRDYVLLFNMVLLPIIQAFNLCIGVGGNFKEMSIAIKNDEINFLDCQYSNTNGCIFDEYNNLTMSCVVMNYLAEKGYILNEVRDKDSGEMSMNNSNYMAFIYFPKNFTSDLTKLIDDREHYDVDSQMYVHHTTKNSLFRDRIISDVRKSISYVLNETSKGCSFNPKSIGIPMKFTALFGKEIESFLNSTAALFIAISAIYFPSIYSSGIMMSERMDGSFSRSMFAGVTIIELLISIFCINTIIVVFQMIGHTFIVYVVFSNPIHITSGLFIYAFITLLLGWIGFLFGLIVAGLSPTKLGGVYAITGWSLTQFMLAGFFWPVEGQTPFLTSISKLLPLYIGGKTMNDIALKGWTFDHPAIRTGTSITFAYVVLLICVLIVLGRFKKDMWVIRK